MDYSTLLAAFDVIAPLVSSTRLMTGMIFIGSHFLLLVDLDNSIPVLWRMLLPVGLNTFRGRERARRFCML